MPRAGGPAARAYGAETRFSCKLTDSAGRAEFMHPRPRAERERCFR
jgi:hypothetical protein